jgi:uncharacterized protein YndB with AHSA1/START domain
MPAIIYKVLIHAAPGKVFDALTQPRHLAAWWTPDCSAEARVGGQVRLEFRAADGTLDGVGVMRIEQLVPGTLLEWQCIAQDYKGETDWLGTTIRFVLSADGHGGTVLDFTHIGLEEGECFDRCSDGWGFVLNTSLKNYLETGTGVPYLAHVAHNAAHS